MSVLLFKPKANPKKYGPAATFTRASVAYDSSLKQVASGLPRIGIDGVMVEEATTNLLPAGAENFVTGWGTSTGASVVASSDAILGHAAYKIQEDTGLSVHFISIQRSLTAGSAYTLTVYAKNAGRTLSLIEAAVSAVEGTFDLVAGTVAVSQGNGKLGTATGKVTAVGDGSYRCELRFTPSTTESHTFRFQLVSTVPYQGDGVSGVSVLYPQIENLPYATSYTPPGTTRAAESLTVPASALNPSAGTIEMDVVTNDAKTNFIFFAPVPSGSNGIDIFFDKENNRVRLLTSDGNLYSMDYCDPFANGKHIIKVRWDANEASLWADGDKKISSLNPHIPLSFADNAYIGSSATCYHINSYISSLRISKIARTDTEMAYTGKLRKDSKTTFLRNWKGAL